MNIKRINAVAIKMNFHFHYYDPDMDYEDDVRAYNDALQLVVKERLEQYLKEYRESFNL